METLRLSDFAYNLPQGLIAQYPTAKREDSRLLVLDRINEKISHRRFKDIVDYFSKGDCLVLNNTKVIPARMIGCRQKAETSGGGGKQEILFVEDLTENTYRVLAKPAKKLSVGSKIFFNNGKSQATVLAEEGMSKIIRFNGNGTKGAIWRKFGQVPLPPYIKRAPEALDRKRYQTIYAREAGATASPTAGLHFTRRLLKCIQAKGVKVVYLTLHINYGTFAPLRCEALRRHKMHGEYFILPQRTAQAVNAASACGRKVFAVGTTSVRVLETSAQGDRNSQTLLAATQGWTDLFIYPPYKFKVVNGLLTNFHFPKSTLLMLVSAFAGKEFLFKAYQQAIERQYRFFSYGDAMLII